MVPVKANSTERPGNRPSVFICVHQFSCSLWCSSWCKHWHLPHVYIMVESCGTSFPLGFMKNQCFTAVGIKQMHVEHPQKTLRFWDGFAFRHSSSDSFPSLQLADHLCGDLSAFRCMHRHCQALTYVMIIGLWLDRLPGNIFFSGLPAIRYCTSMGQHLFGLPCWTRRSVFVNWPLGWLTNSCCTFTFPA